MATDLQQIQLYLDEIGFKYTVREEHDDIIVFFETEKFVNVNGESFIIIAIECNHNGELLQIFAPQAYTVPDNEHKNAFFELLLLLMQDTYFIKFEYYDKRDEIRICIDVPLEDQPLSLDQLHFCVLNIVQIVEQFHQTIMKTIETGIIQRENTRLTMAKSLFDRIVEDSREDLTP